MTPRTRTQRSALRRFIASEHGFTESLEWVLWAPVAILVMGTIFQVGIYQHSQNLAQSIAQSTYEQQRLFGAGSNDGATYASEQLAEVDDVLLNGALSIDQGAETVTVVITGSAPALIPLPGIDFPIEATYVGPTERWTG